MLKKCFFLVIVIFSGSHLWAQTLNLKGGEVFSGDEVVNERPTGNKCYLYTDRVYVNAIGEHCYGVEVRPIYQTDRNQHPKESMNMTVGLTNYHRPEYPKVKTCATSLDGKTSGDDIYSDNTELIYNKFFSSEVKYNGQQFDLGVLISAETKQPKEMRLHKLNALSEMDYDCVNMKNITPVVAELKILDVNLLSNKCYAVDVNKTWAYVDGSKMFAVLQNQSDECMKIRQGAYFAEVNETVVQAQLKINQKK